MLKGYKRLLALSALLSGASIVEDTATGNPLTFLTDLAKPLKILVIPFSDENGVTGLTVKHGGKNLLNPAWLNLEGESTVVGGITFIKNADGSITADGLATSSAQVRFDLTGKFDGDFYFCDNQLVGGDIDIYCYNTTKGERCKQWDGTSGGQAVTNARTKAECKLNSTDTISLNLRVYNGRRVDNVTFKPMLVGKNTTDFSYADFVPITETDISFPVSAGSPTAGQLDIISGVLTVTAPIAGIYQLTPQEITALVGNNTIWSDADGDLTVTFLKKG